MITIHNLGADARGRDGWVINEGGKFVIEYIHYDNPTKWRFRVFLLKHSFCIQRNWY